MERIGEVEVLGGVGGNARSRGKCQADGTDGVRYMVFVLKTGKYGTKMIFLLKIDGGIGKILKIVSKCINRC